MRNSYPCCLSLWNYNPDNSDSHGDYWNGENFSWFNQEELDQATLRTLSLEQSNGELDAGGRLLHAVIRPYLAKVAGVPLRNDFELNTGRLEVEWANPLSSAETTSLTARPPLTLASPLTARETEIFMPRYLTEGRKVIVEYASSVDAQAECDWRYDPNRQTLFVIPENTAPGGVHRLTVTLDPPLETRFPVDSSIWLDFAKWWIGLFSIIMALVWLLLLR